MKPHEIILKFLLSEGIDASMLDDQEDEDEGMFYIYIDDPKDNYFRCYSNKVDECLIVGPTTVICRSCEHNHTYQSVEVGLHHPDSFKHILEMLKCSRNPYDCGLLRDDKAAIKFRSVSSGEEIVIWTK